MYPELRLVQINADRRNLHHGLLLSIGTIRTVQYAIVPPRVEGVDIIR